MLKKQACLQEIATPDKTGVLKTSDVMLLKLLSAHESAPYLKPLTQTDLHSSLTLHTYYTSENEHFHFTKKRVSFNLLSPY